MKDEIKQLLRCAGIRAMKTAAQAAIGCIGAGVVLDDVNWVSCASASALAAVVSLLTSVAGVPEVADGASVIKMKEINQYSEETAEE